LKKKNPTPAEQDIGPLLSFFESMRWWISPLTELQTLHKTGRLEEYITLQTNNIKLESTSGTQIQSNQVFVQRQTIIYSYMSVIITVPQN